MTETALITRDEVSLEAYGDIARVREMTRRLLAMLPSAKQLGAAGAGALAQASLVMGLNPFIGQVWAIPQGKQNPDGTYNTYGIMVGIAGLRVKAHEQARADNGMYTVHYRIPREEEIEGLRISGGDIVRACDLVVSGDRARRHFEFTKEIPRYTGIGVYRQGEQTKMNPLQVARKRAEAEAIKQAFDVPLSFEYGAAPAMGDIELDDVPERYTEHGDGLVNGNADDAIADLYGDEYDERTGDPWVNGTDYHGAPKDETAYADYREVQKEEADHAADLAETWERERAHLAELDLDYVPPDIDEWGSGEWDKLRDMACAHLGYNHPNHVRRTLAQVVDKNDKRDLAYRTAWHLLQEHQRSKLPEAQEETD